MIIPKNKTSYISVKQRYIEENKGGEGLTKEGYTVNRIINCTPCQGHFELV